MAENSQLSDETKNNSTDTSSTDASSAVIGNHENAVVPHKISNHDKLVQTMVMVDGEWINVNDTNDQANMKEDMHKVNKKVVEAQKGIVEAKNAADSAVKYADSAVSASKVNSDAIVAQSSAISEAKAATDSATAEVQQLKANAASDAASIRADVAAASETLTGQGKQIATISATLDGLNTKYEGVSDDLSKLSGTVATNSTQIDQNKKSIALKADQATVGNLSGEVNQNTAQLKVQADQISSKVSSEDFKALDNKVGGAIAQIGKNTTAIDQTNKQISLKVDQTEVNNVKNTAQQNSSRLDAMANEIQSKVTSTDVNNIVDGKGYATTSTVQLLITQESGKINESITNLEGKFNSSSSVNLAEKTNQGTTNWMCDPGTGATNLTEVNINGVRGVRFNNTRKTTSWWVAKYVLNLDYFEPNQDYIISFDIRTSSDNFNQGGILNIARGDSSHPYLANTSFKTNFKQNQLTHVSCTGHSYSSLDKNGETFYLNCVGLGQCDWVDIVNLKIARGTIDKGYSPAPSDNATVTQLQSVTASIDGLQSTVANKADKSQITQLSNLVQSKVSSSDFNSKITQLANDINLRVQKDGLLSQINIAAGHTLIQSNKIYFDADSFVMSPNSKAFIPSAYITEINADKITTGTLDVSKLNVKNFSADNIVGGTLNGVVVKTGVNDRYFQTSKDNIYWVRNGSMSLVGNDTYLNSANGLNIADMNNIQLTTWGGATVNKDGSITNNSGNSGHPKIIIDDEGKYNPDDPYGSEFSGGTGDSEIAQWVGNKEYTVLTRGKGFIVHLNDGNNKSIFAIQKDNKVGFYVGQGENGNQVNVYGNFNVYGAKNSAVKTSQGGVAVSAYETAEYYFGDIGEGQTGSNGVAYVGIEKLFNETVNTNIPYQVFLTAYVSGNIWVDQREHDRFVVKSDRPNVKFGWEIKAKRRGYENTRLQKIN